jgi:hypothetical protein
MDGSLHTAVSVYDLAELFEKDLVPLDHMLFMLNSIFFLLPILDGLLAIGEGVGKRRHRR